MFGDIAVDHDGIAEDADVARDAACGVVDLDEGVMVEVVGQCAAAGGEEAVGDHGAGIFEGEGIEATGDGNAGAEGIFSVELVGEVVLGEHDDGDEFGFGGLEVGQFGDGVDVAWADVLSLVDEEDGVPSLFELVYEERLEEAHVIGFGACGLDVEALEYASEEGGGQTIGGRGEEGHLLCGIGLPGFEELVGCGGLAAAHGPSEDGESSFLVGGVAHLGDSDFVFGAGVGESRIRLCGEGGFP